MPHSVFTGRIRQPGEPLFLQDDTDAAVALAEEERDSCPRCGMPKVWCRDPDHQFAFEPVEEVCWPTYRMAQHQRGDAWKHKGDEAQAATLIATKFRDTVEPDLFAGLGLAVEQVSEADEAAHDRQG